MTFIDLSLRVENGLAVYPGDDPPVLRQCRFLVSDKYNDFRIESGMHTGTHVDTPMHLTESRKFICDYPVDEFCGEAVLLNFEGEFMLDYRDEFDSIVCSGDIVILGSGHWKLFGSDDYFSSHPIVSRALADFLVARRVKMIGLDFPSPDNYPYDIHHLLFAHRIFILENLTNLDRITVKRFFLYAFPLNIRADSSPVRVVAQVSL